MPNFADYTASIKLNANDGIRGLRNFDAAAKRTGDRAERRFDRLGDSIGSSLRSKISFAAVGAGLTALALNAAKLEQRFNGVRKTTGLTSDQINGLKENLLDFSQQVPVTVDNLGEIATVAGQLGIQGVNDISKFTRVFAQLQIASDNTISGELGAQQFARFLDLSGAGVDSASRIASAFTELGNTSKFTEGQLLSTALEVSKISRSFNISAESTLGLAAAFTELSIQPEVARSTVLRFFEAVNKASLDGEGIDELSSITGLTAERIDDLRKTKPEQLLAIFAKGMADAQEEGRSLTDELKELGLSGIVVNASLKALSQNSERLTEQTDKASKASAENTALAEEAAVAAGTLTAEWIKTKNSFVALGDSLASSGLLDFLKQALRLVRQINESLGGLIERVPERIQQIANGQLVAPRGEAIPNTPLQNARAEEFNARRESEEEVAPQASQRTISSLAKEIAADIVRREAEARRNGEELDLSGEREELRRLIRGEISQDEFLTDNARNLQQDSRIVPEQTINNSTSNETTNNITVNTEVTTADNPSQAANVIDNRTKSAIQLSAAQ